MIAKFDLEQFDPLLRHNLRFQVIAINPGPALNIYNFYGTLHKKFAFMALSTTCDIYVSLIVS
jgi:hypothetical protein